jgi:folate-binding protein YgfZ
MSEANSLCLLDDLGALRIQGADAVKFLQGQLSNDMQQLQAQRLLRAGLHNPQGRTLALLALTIDPSQEIVALLPRELTGSVSDLLRRYVLRSKVAITDASEQLRLYGVMRADDSLRPAGQLCRYGLGTDARHVLLQARAATPLSSTQLSREHWRALDVAAGLPQVTAINSGEFVAQMLNLDCIEAISFGKGCYTGQEIIARAHYRGRVKRRMQRFATEDTRPLEPGSIGRLSDGRHYRVIEVARTEEHRLEFLAVAHLPGMPQDGTAPEGETRASETIDGDRALLTATALPLSYELPA